MIRDPLERSPTRELEERKKGTPVIRVREGEVIGGQSEEDPRK